MSEKQMKWSDGPKSLLNQVVSLQLRDRSEEWFTDVELKYIGNEGVCVLWNSRNVISTVFVPADNINYILQRFSAPSATEVSSQQK